LDLKHCKYDVYQSLLQRYLSVLLEKNKIGIFSFSFLIPKELLKYYFFLWIVFLFCNIRIWIQLLCLPLEPHLQPFLLQLFFGKSLSFMSRLAEMLSFYLCFPWSWHDRDALWHPAFIGWDRVMWILASAVLQLCLARIIAVCHQPSWVFFLFFLSENKIDYILTTACIKALWSIENSPDGFWG
jgi:hypothetical protein